MEHDHEQDDLGGRLSEQELCPDELLDGQMAAFERDVERLIAQEDHFVHVPCPACGVDKDEPALSKFSFAYVRCSNCRTLFMNPRPDRETMAAYYANSENYRYWAEHIFPASEESRREKIHKPWLQRVLDYCQAHDIPQGVLVEVGAGFGTFSTVAHASGAFEEVIAIEPTPELAKACRERGVTVIEKRIEDLTDEIAQADVAVSFEVIEHLFDPKLLFHKMRRILKPGGLMVISCPNGEGFDIATLGAESLAIDPEHVNLFNPMSLRFLAQFCGFEILSLQTPGRLDAEFVRNAVLEGRHSLDQEPFLKRVLLTEWERLGWPFQQFLAHNGLSSHMWLAARKPK